MLLSAEIDLVLKKRDCKQNLVWPGGFYGGKIDFTLLAKVVALYMGPIAIDV